MATTSLGFKTPPDGSIGLLGCSVLLAGEPLADDGLHDWNDAIEVTAKVTLEVDLKTVISGCGFTASDQPAIGVALGWKSTGTGLHGSTPVNRVVNGENELSITLPGECLGEELVLRPSVILAENIERPSSPIVAARKGSRLWATTLRVSLEGAGSQFPTTVVNFDSTGVGPAAALWKVRVDAKLSSHFSNAVRLYLNETNERTAAYLKSPREKKQDDFRRFLKADVVNQLLIVAFNSDLNDLRSEAEEPGTLAEALLEIHQTYFPTSSLEDTARQFRTDPAAISSKVIGTVFQMQD